MWLKSAPARTRDRLVRYTLTHTLTHTHRNKASHATDSFGHRTVGQSFDSGVVIREHDLYGPDHFVYNYIAYIEVIFKRRALLQRFFCYGFDACREASISIAYVEWFFLLLPCIMDVHVVMVNIGWRCKIPIALGTRILYAYLWIMPIMSWSRRLAICRLHFRNGWASRRFVVRQFFRPGTEPAICLEIGGCKRVRRVGC